jgi:F-type H+-transporting ATPase subunit alpha
MQIKADEISKIIQRQIEGYETDVDTREIGTVISVGDGIARVYGLDRVMFNELLEFPQEVFGLALNLEEDSVGVVLLGESHMIKEGDMVKRTHKIMQVPSGQGMVGSGGKDACERAAADRPQGHRQHDPHRARPA